MESKSEQVLARINAALQRIETASKNIALAQNSAGEQGAIDAQAVRRAASDALTMLDSVIRKAESGNG